MPRAGGAAVDVAIMGAGRGGFTESNIRGARAGGRLLCSLSAKLCEKTFVRYFASSGMALGVDATTFFALVAIGAPAGPASAVAYGIGILAHWLITSRAVFAAEVAARGRARTRQKFMFVLSALAGLAATTAIVSAGAYTGVNLVLTKGVAVAVSFTINWLLRRFFVFPPQEHAV